MTNEKFAMTNFQWRGPKRHWTPFIPNGRRCCAAQKFKAEQQLRPAKKARIFILREGESFAAIPLAFFRFMV
jgi:hypothetical protein